MADLTENFTFQLSDTGVVLNSEDSPTLPYVDVTRVSGLDNAPYRETRRDHEGADGAFMDAEFETGRDITIEGTIYVPLGSSVESYLDSLKANWAPSRSLIPLFLLPDDTVGVRFINVKPLGCHYDVEAIRRIGMTNANFVAFAEDPRIYSYSPTTQTLPLGAIIFTGFSFNLGFNFGFGGLSTTTDGQYVYTNGNRPTPPLLTINGPVSNPVILNETASKQMNFIIDLADGEQLMIDVAKRTVRLNGTVNRRSTLVNAGWFDLQPGANFIRFRGESGSGSLDVFYRDAWR